jgi:hypothetical protein
MSYSLVSNGLLGFTVAALNSPIQFDAYSCGVFDVWMFYRQVDKKASKDMECLRPYQTPVRALLLRIDRNTSH